MRSTFCSGVTGISVNTVEERPTPRDYRVPDTVEVEVHGRGGERLTTLDRLLHSVYGPIGMYWMGFDTDGRFLCHLDHPHDGLTAYEFGPDYWLGVHADELGVETVVVYELTMPEAA